MDRLEQVRRERLAEADRGYALTPDDDPRHLYDNVLVALDASRNLNNGEPAFLLRCLDDLDLSPRDRFLHVGCGVGYYTAVVAMAVAEGTVVGVELDAPLAERAGRNLARWPNVDRVRRLRRDSHPASPQCWLHAPRFCLSYAAENRGPRASSAALAADGRAPRPELQGGESRCSTT